MRRFLAIVLLALVASQAYAGIMDAIKKEIREAVQGALKDAGMDVDWEQVALEFDSEGLTKMQVSAKAKDLDLLIPALGMQATVTDLQVGAQLAVSLDGFSIASLGPIVADGVVVAMDPPPTPPPKQGEPFLELPIFPAISLPEMVASMKFGKVLLNIKELRLGPPGQATIVTATLKNTEARPDRLQLNLGVKGKDLDVASQLRVSLRRTHGVLDEVALTGKYDVQQGDMRISGPLKLRAWERYAIATTVQVDLPNTERLSIPVAGAIAGGKVRLEVRTKIPEAWTGGRASSRAKCDVDLLWGETPKQQLTWDASCDVNAVAQKIEFKEQLPERYRLAVRTDGKITHLDDPNPKLEGVVSVESPEASGAAVSTRLSSSLRFSSHLLDPADKWQLAPKFDLAVSVKRFETLVAGLKNTPGAIPASLNDLTGPIELRVRTDHASERDVPLTMDLQARLSSERQTLHTDVAGKLQVDHLLDPKVIGAQLDVLLTQIRLELPDVLLEAPPQLVQDSRFARPPPMGPPPPGPEVRYHVTVRTPDDRRLLLLSNLAQDPIPIAVDIVATHDKPPKVVLDLGRFRLDLFRRQAEVQKFRFALRDDEEIGDLEGQVKIDFADYDIFADVSGTVNHTVLKMRSEPPLQESDIYAVLLFGEPMSGVGGEDAGSAASMQAAAASGAVALASIYYLASTPVESIQYDPTTQSFAAKVQVGEGTTMSVGRQGEDTSRVGIRRRLWGSWFVHTYVDRDDATGENKVASFLEWSFAY